jgi:hypothetical protein
VKISILLSLAFLFSNCSSLPGDRSDSSHFKEVPDCKHSCVENQVCINTFTKAGAQCSPIPETAPLKNLILPFDATTEVFCTHSSGSGSHSGLNAYYALDLASDYSEPAAIVRAAADGVAYVFGAENGGLCPEPKGAPKFAESSTCGDSWGNRVKILHSGGYYTFYVHLDRPLVKTGDIVHQGDPIGVTGWTGAAGHRHLHWSVQKLPGTSEAEWVNHIAWAGGSVPFLFHANESGADRILNSATISCAHANVGDAPAAEQPRFKGIR